MKAFQSVRAEMRESCIELTHPGAEEAEPSRHIARVGREEMEEEDSHIDPWMEAAFYGLTHANETGESFALISCFMNGKPAAVIALTQNDGRRTHVMPLFLACQPWMNFASHAQHEAGKEDEAD
jgi:hypothetical protein